MRAARAPAPTVCDCRVCACRARLSFSCGDPETLRRRQAEGADRRGSAEVADILFLVRTSRSTLICTSESPAAIDLAAMRYPHDEDDESIVEDFVDDAVVAGADPTQADKLALQGHSPGMGAVEGRRSRERFGGAQPPECERVP